MTTKPLTLSLSGKLREKTILYEQINIIVSFTGKYYNVSMQILDPKNQSRNCYVSKNKININLKKHIVLIFLESAVIVHKDSDLSLYKSAINK